MKRNPSNYISIVLLALFTCVFSFQHIAATAYAKHGQNTTTSFTGSTLSIHKPCKDDSAGDQSFFENENETEDESKSEFNAGLPVFNLQSVHSILVSENAAYSSSLVEDLADKQHPLYLLIRAFRI